MRDSLRFTLLLCLLLAIATPTSADSEARMKPYEFVARNGERVDAELGELDVPENRSSDASRTITLRYVRFKSTSEKPGSPIVYLAGGPGGSGIGTARGSRFPLFMAMREFGDVIAFDQRGTGMSGGDELDCDERYMMPLDEPTDRATAAAVMNDALKKCFSRLRDAGIDVNAYNTKESAADLDALRVALGAEKITLWGISYGTHLALATMKYHGEGVDRVILAGLEALHHTWKLPSDQQALLEEISRLAAADPATKDVTPDLTVSITKLLSELEKEPKSVELTHPANGMTINVAVGKYDLQAGLASLLRGPETFTLMPDMVHRLEEGDWTALALFVARGKLGEAPHAMSTAMDCASGASDEWTERIAKESRSALLGDGINFPSPAICVGLGIDDLGDTFRSPVKSDIPALLISGTLDGRTPVANGEEVEEHLSNAQHLIIEGAGHSDPLFLSSPKILEAMQAFMRGETIPTLRIKLPTMSFMAPRSVVTLDDAALEQYVGTYKINEEESRAVMKAGNLLYTRRGKGPVLPIRPSSETEFFYERSGTRLEFEIDDEGGVNGMVVYAEGSSEGERAEKID